MRKNNVLKPLNLLIIFLVLALMAVLFLGMKKDKQERDKILAVINQEQREQNNKTTTDLADSADNTSQTAGIYEKLRARKDISILILGDAIGRGDGVNDADKWCNKANSLIEQQFSVKADIKTGDSNSKTVFSGFYDYIKNFSDKKYDMVVICFGENDISLLKLEYYQQMYEALVRKVKSENSSADIMCILESSIQSNKTYPAAVQEIAKQYGLLSLDLREAFKNSNKTYKDLSSDNIMPNKEGYNIYASAFADAVKKAVSDNRTLNSSLPDYIYKDAKSFESIKAGDSLLKNEGFTKNGNTYVSNTAGNNISINVTGSIFGFEANYSKNGGKIKIYINDKLNQEIDLYSPSDIPKPILISLDPSNKNNVLKIENENSKNIKSAGKKIALSLLLTN